MTFVNQHDKGIAGWLLLRIRIEDMNILLLGSGGREHALAWAIARSKRLGKLFIAPGNPGMAACGTLVSLDVSNHEQIAEFCLTDKIDLVVVGPEAPLVAGIADDLQAKGIKVFGAIKRSRSA